jgi:hypothetical protein
MDFEKIKQEAFQDELKKIAASPQAPAKIFAQAGKLTGGQSLSQSLPTFTRRFGNMGKRLTPRIPGN